MKIIGNGYGNRQWVSVFIHSNSRPSWSVIGYRPCLWGRKVTVGSDLTKPNMSRSFWFPLSLLALIETVKYNYLFVFYRNGISITITGIL